jgi:NMD protein affecting ribosome stability and mRNA decay
MSVCSNCGSENVTLSVVDGRNQEYCSDCNFLRYEEPKSRNGAQHLTDDLIREVTLSGEASIAWVVLLNVVFRQTDGAPTPELQLSEWAVKNHLSFDLATNSEMVTFRRSKPVTTFPKRM